LGCSNISGKNENRSNNVNYELVEDAYVYQNKEAGIDIVIRYPKANGLSEEINNLIRQESMSILNRYEQKDIEESFWLDIEYKIKLANSEMISIVLSGEGYVSGSNHPNKWLYSTNIDIANIKKLKLEDFIIIDERLLDILRSAQFTLVSPSQMEGFEYWMGLSFVLEKLPSNKALAYIKRADEINDIYNDTYSYLTDKGTLGISFGTSHAIGGHAEYEIQIEKLTDIWIHL
jgi:hypothetical protein